MKKKRFVFVIYSNLKTNKQTNKKCLCTLEVTQQLEKINQQGRIKPDCNSALYMFSPIKHLWGVVE